MMAMKGKSLGIKVSTADDTYNTVADLNEGSMSADGDNQDITTLSDAYINRVQGLKDVSYSLSGFYKPDDTNGQAVIRDAWINGSDLYVQYLPDGSNGFKQKVVVSSFEVSASVDGMVEVSIELEGADALSTVSA